MAARKSRRNGSEGRRYTFGYPTSQLREDVQHRNFLPKQKEIIRQTRDYHNPIANEPLSFAEDLRRYSPDRKKFHNIDGSIAETTYKPVVVEKKSTLHKLGLYGVMCLVSFVLGVLLSASVEVYANKYYSLIKFW